MLLVLEQESDNCDNEIDSFILCYWAGGNCVGACIQEDPILDLVDPLEPGEQFEDKVTFALEHFPIQRLGCYSRVLVLLVASVH